MALSLSSAGSRRRPPVGFVLIVSDPLPSDKLLVPFQPNPSGTVVAD
jgi:hypothetical protein